MRKLKIAVLRNHHDGSFRTRCQAPLAWLLSQQAIDVIPPMKAWEADVVLMHGQWQPGGVAIANSLQRHGIRVIADLDENIFAAPADHPAAKMYRNAAFQTRVRQLIGAVDAVFVPTNCLASRFSDFAKRISVTPNGIPLEEWKQIAKSKPLDRVRVIGFAGTTAHSANLEILRPALAKLSNKFREQDIRFVCFGSRPSWLAGTVAGAKTVDACEPDSYPINLASLEFDIALAPVSNSEFDQSRSALKFLEYTATGAVTIASNQGGYASAIQNRQTGLLVDNQAASWEQAILKLVRDHDLRRELFTAAQRSLEAHDISRTAPAMLAAIEATEPNRSRTLFAFPRMQSNEFCRDVDIVIPIYNSPELTKQAIEAALPELDARHRLILVDDASPDPAVSSMLREFESVPWVTVYRVASNNGFVGTCNFAVNKLARPDADVILMNSDTRPMPGFVARLGATAGSNPAIGTVTAVSNQGWIASVPDFSDSSELAALEHPLILSPTACGFLLYIKREVIRKYGLFDPAFSPGYCEEVDLSLRISPEYVSVIDPGCWTWHANSVAFGDSKFKLSADHNAVIDQRYPQFRFELSAFQSSRPLMKRGMDMLTATRDPRPRVLHVLQSHGANHGTGKHVQDLGAALSDRFLSLTASARESRDAAQEQLELYCGDVALGAWPYMQPGWPQTAGDLPANDQSWASLLADARPDLIHFHHIKNHALSLLARLTATGIPVVVSTHDYYFLCPDFSLQYCPGVNSCDSCFPKLFNKPPEYQRLRRALFHASMKQAAAVIAPSQTAAAIVRQAYPDLNILVFPHGIRPISRIAPAPGSKIRFGMLGNVNSVKGIDIILKAWPLIAPAKGAELHIFGQASESTHIQRCQELGIHYHGAYVDSNLPTILSQIDIGLLPSQVPETFSYALSEFFAGGIPVIGSDYGALSERIENGVNGFKIVKDDVHSWASTISRLTQDAALRERIRKGVRPPDSLEEMGARYADLYREVMANRQRKSLSSLSAATAIAPDSVPAHSK